MKILINNFLNYLKVNEGKADNTVSSYKTDLSQLNDYLNDNIINITDVKLQDLNNFLVRLDDKNKETKGQSLSARTKARKIASIKEFFKYLFEIEEIIADNPTLKLKTPKIPKGLPTFLSENESFALINVTRKNKNKASRDMAILAVFLNCGLRVSEIINIKLGDIKNNILRVTGKGSKTREIPLNEMTIYAINQYLRDRPDVEADELFITERKAGFSVSGMQYLVKKYMKEANINTKKYSTHDLRHTAATLMHNSGVDIRTIQEILGHTDLSTTQIYTHLNQEIKQEAVNSNPLNQKFLKKQ